MAKSELKPWKCGAGHVLGAVRRNGSGVRQLMLWRQASHVPPRAGWEVDVMAVVEGYAADVRCSICGRVRTWVPGQEALERLLRRYAPSHQADGQADSLPYMAGEGTPPLEEGVESGGFGS